MDDIDLNGLSDSYIEPNAVVLKYKDNTFHVIKFDVDGDMVAMSECVLDNGSILETDTIKDMAQNECFYVRINFDFDYDSHEGVIEFDICEHVVLSNTNNDAYVYAEDVLTNEPDTFIQMYLAQI